MGSASRYWGWVSINAAGKRKIKEIADAKAFFSQKFLSHESSTLSDVLIQRQLYQIWQSDAPDQIRYLAEICLRCLISNQIEQICIYIEVQFGNAYGFTCNDLFPIVLVDEVLLSNARSRSAYRSLASEILQTFNPYRGSLTAWTSSLTRQYFPLKQFLLERGAYCVSDWSILNDTRLPQLQRIFSDFEPLAILSPLEIYQSRQLLEAYEDVYRRDCRQQAKPYKKCQPPTPAQLQQMADYLRQKLGLTLRPDTVLEQLQTLAQQLRRYRIYARGGTVPMASLDQPEVSAKVQQLQAPSAEQQNEQAEFLAFYRQQLLESLDDAIAQATTKRLMSFERAITAQHFLLALYLFHCQGRSMAKIAPLVNLTAQYQVTRLLKLKEYRATVWQQLRTNLRDRLLEQIQAYANPSQLQTLNQGIEAALEEQIVSVIQEAEAEVSLTKRYAARSLFACRLCRHLERQTINAESTISPLTYSPA